MKPILYFDMDNVLVDFQSGVDQLDASTLKAYEDRYEEVPSIFSTMRPMPDAIETFNRLSQYFDVYILSTAPWKNPTAWSDKLCWVKEHIGEHGYKRLILSHHKNLNRGAYLIDDRTKNGASDFEGELILFGSSQFPNWQSVEQYLMNKINH